MVSAKLVRSFPFVPSFSRKLTFACQRPRGYRVVIRRTEEIMAIEMLTYSQLGERLSCSPEAARALVKRHRLPRQKANDGKALVSIDLSEINHKPMPARSPADPRPVTASLNARIDALQAGIEARLDAVQAGLSKVEAAAACHLTDFERERERLDELVVGLLRTGLDAQTAKEAVVRFEGELPALLRTGVDAQTAKEAVARLEGELGVLQSRTSRHRRTTDILLFSCLIAAVMGVAIAAAGLLSQPRVGGPLAPAQYLPSQPLDPGH
jgi:hypothetical protein